MLKFDLFKKGKAKVQESAQERYARFEKGFGELFDDGPIDFDELSDYSLVQINSMITKPNTHNPMYFYENMSAASDACNRYGKMIVAIAMNDKSPEFMDALKNWCAIESRDMRETVAVLAMMKKNNPAMFSQINDFAKQQLSTQIKIDESRFLS